MPTVEEVIRVARDLHPLFTRERHPNGVLFRRTDVYQRELSGKLADTDPGLLREREQVPLPLEAPNSFEGGIALPPHLRVTGGQVNIGANLRPEPLSLVEPKDVFYERPRYAAEIRGGSAYLLGGGREWSSAESVEFWYWPLPTALADADFTPALGRISAEVDLPGDPTMVLAYMLADLMASRTDEMDSLNFSGQLAREEMDYIMRLTGKGRATVGIVREG